MLKCLSTGASMWVTTSLSFKELIWTLAFLNARIVGDRATQYLCIKFKEPNVSNAIVITNQSITDNLHGVVKLMEK